MKRFIMEFQLPNENLESAQEMGFYLTNCQMNLSGSWSRWTRKLSIFILVVPPRMRG